MFQSSRHDYVVISFGASTEKKQYILYDSQFTTHPEMSYVVLGPWRRTAARRVRGPVDWSEKNPAVTSRVISVNLVIEIEDSDPVGLTFRHSLNLSLSIDLCPVPAQHDQRQSPPTVGKKTITRPTLVSSLFIKIRPAFPRQRPLSTSPTGHNCQHRDI
ncbi:hypothetical protein E4U57_003507 [Claviceps arundinis]|uniref:Uncharacterized protein n=1 Tax=Claviceps arundinis TaxID=1623583 RepID=A0A9P7MYD3_9HYPO|nr:hypothetical protein E4U57_003507 [Claviceps arundinis]KAG5975926.1 hypothetical protein E4U56_002965 [Claviceps arundinis]